MEYTPHQETREDDVTECCFLSYVIASVWLAYSENSCAQQYIQLYSAYKCTKQMLLTTINNNNNRLPSIKIKFIADQENETSLEWP